MKRKFCGVFVERILMVNPGDNVFYTDNQEGKGTGTYCPVAVEIIKRLGLIPFFYLGTGLNIRKNNLDSEIRDDFWKSKVVVLVLGKGEGWRSIEDNWAMPELKHAISRGITCLIYTTDATTAEEVKNLALPCSPVAIKDENHFKTVFEQHLRQLMPSA